MLVRREVFDTLGLLDEGLLSTQEHIDLCLTVRERGGTIYLEPDSYLTYVPGPPFTANDLPFYFLRWSDEWNRASMQRFNKKWRLDDSPKPEMKQFVRTHRREFFQTLTDKFHWRLTGAVSWLVGTNKLFHFRFI